MIIINNLTITAKTTTIIIMGIPVPTIIRITTTITTEAAVITIRILNLLRKKRKNRVLS